MVRVQLEFVLAALIQEKLKSGCARDQLSVSPYEIRTWGHKIEQKSGLAVLNGFFPIDITRFLTRSPLFREDYYRRDCEGNPCYILKTESLRRMSAYPDIAYCLLIAWDPVLNYPMEFIRESGLLEVLEGSATESAS